MFTIKDLHRKLERKQRSVLVTICDTVELRQLAEYVHIAYKNMYREYLVKSKSRRNIYDEGMVVIPRLTCQQ